MNVSIIIPVLNEHQSLPQLTSEILTIMDKQDCEYEIIFVDDGSNDGTWVEINDLKKSHNQVRAVRHRCNAGKSQAIASGVQVSNFDLIVTLDGDLQDDPKEIPRFIDQIEEGYHDLVVGWKEKRKDPLNKTLPSKIFNFTLALVTGLKLHDFNCGFKAFTKQAFNSVHLYGELHRFIPFLVYHNGYSVTEISVDHRPREYGHSKFGAERYLKGAIDLLTVLTLTRFKYRPAHLFSGLGIILFLIGSFCLGYLFVLWCIGDAPIGDRPLLLFGIMLIIIGLQLALFGLLAEFVLFRTMKERSNDIIAEKID